jgi:hypothetical protein
VVKINSFSMAGMRCGGQRQLHYVCNVLWSKMSVSLCLECVVVKLNTFSMAGMRCGVKINSFSMAGMRCGGQRQLHYV